METTDMQAIREALQRAYDRWNRTGGCSPSLTSEDARLFKSALAILDKIDKSGEGEVAAGEPIRTVVASRIKEEHRKYGNHVAQDFDWSLIAAAKVIGTLRELGHMRHTQQGTGMVLTDEWIADAVNEYAYQKNNNDDNVIGYEDALRWFQRNGYLSAPAKAPAEVDWNYAERLSENILVAEALDNFQSDPTGDNGICLVRTVLEQSLKSTNTPEHGN